MKKMYGKAGIAPGTGRYEKGHRFACDLRHRPALFVVRCTAPLFSGMDRHYIVRRSHRAGGGYRTGHPVRYQS